ncbi:MAG TPA: Scr1 family TA system antitoxin-like transcriptional regulator [Streptosporangiaceae bacterium]|nr:Scr1 family TA system antitoxin-like transcriptional regulator [Streptosporangiaceae bacterium]
MPTSPHPPVPRPQPGNHRPAITSAQASHDAPAPAARHRLGAHLRTLRQARSLRLRPGCQLHLIISQDALIKPVATADVITAQLRHLLALADHPDITLQITAPYDTPPVLSPSFTILTFTDAPAVACCQGPAGQAILTHRTADATTTQATFQAITHTAQTPEDSVGFIKYLINPAP